MLSTNALRTNNDESETKPKANKSWKWKHILKPIWDEKDLYTGNGITPSVPPIILPCDPRRKIRYTDGNKAAGNTGVIRYWRSWYLRIHRQLFGENVFE